MNIMTNNNVYSKELIWKSICRRWITNRKEHPWFSMITLPLNLLDPFYQKYIYLTFTSQNSIKWIEQYLKLEEIKINVHESSNV